MIKLRIWKVKYFSKGHQLVSDNYDNNTGNVTSRLVPLYSLKIGIFICKSHHSFAHHLQWAPTTCWLDSWMVLHSNINFLTGTFNGWDPCGLNDTVFRSSELYLVYLVFSVMAIVGIGLKSRPSSIALLLLLVLCIHLSYLLLCLSRHLLTKHFGSNFRNICCSGLRTNQLLPIKWGRHLAVDVFLLFWSPFGINIKP